MNKLNIYGARNDDTPMHQESHGYTFDVSNDLFLIFYLESFNCQGQNLLCYSHVGYNDRDKLLLFMVKMCSESIGKYSLVALLPGAATLVNLASFCV